MTATSQIQMSSIRAGTLTEINESSGEWVFVDLGFANKAKSCGLLVGNGEPRVLSFSQLQCEIASICNASPAPLNLLLEAPLSVAFTENGNPTGRSIEKRGGQSRYWYVGPGSSVLVTATYLLRRTHDLSPRREIRLFEGFVSFKSPDVQSSHSQDVIALREVAWARDLSRGRIIASEKLKLDVGDQLFSAFRVAGMDFGIPPVIEIT